MALSAVPLASAVAGATRFRIGNNVSDTYRGQILLDNGETATAILKDLPAKELANELLGATIARASDLPVPDHYLTIVRNDAFPATKGPLTQAGDRLVFASVDVGQPSVQFRYFNDQPSFAGMFANLLNWDRLGDLYGFDTWTANTDRHAGNLLFGGRSRVWLIDHGRILGGDEWVETLLDPLGEFEEMLSHWLTSALNVPQTDRAVLGAALFERRQHDRPLVDEMIDASRISTLLSEDELRAVSRFLTDRVGVIAYYANKALGRATVV